MAAECSTASPHTNIPTVAIVATFNTFAESGIDAEFGRGDHPWSEWMCGDPNQKPNANLGTLGKGPYTPSN